MENNIPPEMHRNNSRTAISKCFSWNDTSFHIRKNPEFRGYEILEMAFNTKLIEKFVIKILKLGKNLNEK